MAELSIPKLSASISRVSVEGLKLVNYWQFSTEISELDLRTNRDAVVPHVPPLLYGSADAPQHGSTSASTQHGATPSRAALQRRDSSASLGGNTAD